MKDLNTIYRGVPKTTDVLSFPQQDSNELSVTSYKLEKREKLTSSSLVTEPALSLSKGYSSLLLGDIVINIPVAETQARDLGMNFYDEISRLMIHGILHLLGYEHVRCSYKAKIMRKKEEEISNAIKKIN